MNRQQDRLGEHYDRYIRHDVDEANKNNFASHDFNAAFAEKNKNLSVIQEPDIKYVTHDNYLIVSSKERDIIHYPSSSQFVLNLDQEYRNISRIELIQCIIPDKNNVTSEPYLLLNIKELENTMDSNNKEISEAFSMLQLNQPVVPDSFIQLITQIHENVVLIYKTPKASLSKITLSITDSNGVIFDFGGAGTRTKAYQTTFVFKITTLDSSQKSLNQRNVY
jgi:hypothetical protein